MSFPRSSGILLHPTSLPGRYGIGDFGTAAYQFIEFLSQSGQTLWQVLPLGPTDHVNSPYQSPSAFAGNPLLINPDKLVEEGLLSDQDVSSIPGHTLSDDRVNYEAVKEYKIPLLKRAFHNFHAYANQEQKKSFDAFCAEQKSWLNDYALFMALKERFNASWNQWEQSIALREPAAIKQWETELAEQITFHKYLQYIFYEQWYRLKSYANGRGIRIIGDLPIYVAYDSADVWANPTLFKLDDNGNPTVVAGVPPDYFSADGQLWGNPIYQWEQMAKKGFVWWVERMRHTLEQVDIVRIDHFRGLESYWEVKAGETTARNGKWVPGTGEAFFNKLKRVFGEKLPIIAEDLGIITPEVEKLRDKFELPGMKILHFAFGDDAKNPYLPHNHSKNSVVYTGTHDNNTTIGWFLSLSDEERTKVQCYLGRDGSDIAWELMRLALMSVADICIYPLQDALRLGSEARMNTPGTAYNNWEWRVRSEMMTSGVTQGLYTLTHAYGRCK